MSESATDRLIRCAERLTDVVEQLTQIRARELDLVAEAVEDDEGEGFDGDGMGFGADLSGAPIRTH